MKYLVAALIIVGIASAIYLQPNDQEIIADENNTAVVAAPYSATLIKTSPASCATALTAGSGQTVTVYQPCSYSTGTVSISGGIVSTIGNKTYVDGQLFNIEEKR